MTEQPKIIKVKRKRRKSSTWQKILLKDLELTDLQLFQENLHANMTTAAYDLEKRRNPKDYIK